MPSRLWQNSAPFFFVLWRLNIYFISVQHFPFELQHKIGEEDNTKLFFFFLKMNIKVKTERRSDETRVGQKISGVCAGSALLWRPKGRPSLVKSSAAVQGKNMDQTVIVWINTFPNWFQMLAVTAVTWSVHYWDILQQSALRKVRFSDIPCKTEQRNCSLFMGCSRRVYILLFWKGFKMVKCIW